MLDAAVPEEVRKTTSRFKTSNYLCEDAFQDRAILRNPEHGLLF